MTSPEISDKHIEIRLIKDWLDGQPSRNSARIEEMLNNAEHIHHLFMNELGKRLAPALTDHLQLRPQSNIIEKTHVAKWLTEQLARFGLAVRCPKTGQAAVLMAVRKYDNPSRGGFQISAPDPDVVRGRRRVTTTSTQFPSVELVPKLPGDSPQVTRTER